MKLSETKHKHSLTNILKVCLFGLIMILPFLAILPSTLYFAYNEHAQNYTHEEVIETYEYETNEVNSVDDLVVGNIYKYTFSVADINTLNANVCITSLARIYINDGLIYETDSNIYGIYIDIGINYINAKLRENNIDLISFSVFKKSDITTDTIIYFVYQSIPSLETHNLINYISASDYLGEKNVEIVSSEQSPLNAFNTASNNIWNSPIFNWVNNGLGSIAIANMLTVFGIARNTFISNILIYWLSITAIYIIIDIVISAFTILTHLITKKAE